MNVRAAAGLRVVALLLAGALVGIRPAAADDRSPLFDATLAATCAACHGTFGRSLPQAPVPALAGLDAGRVRDAMRDFRSGARAGTVMPQIAKGYSDAQIERLAAYFAAQPPR